MLLACTLSIVDQTIERYASVVALAGITQQSASLPPTSTSNESRSVRMKVRMSGCLHFPEQPSKPKYKQAF
jgi:hypothetical protein